MRFNAKKTTNEIIKFIQDYYTKNNITGAVIGLSGGKDSAVCLALMVKAIGASNVLALWLPDNSREKDKQDAKVLAEMFNVKLCEFALERYSNEFIDDFKIKNSVNDDDLSDVLINIKPRLRMMTLYSYAAMMSKVKKKGYLVIGTSNKSERFVGYFTKGGDGVCDIAPIMDLYVDEVIKIGDYLGIPKSITHKTPDDGLSGLTDEEKLGFSYEDVKKVAIEYENNVKDLSVSDDVRKKILDRHLANAHKFFIPMYKNNNRMK